MDFFRGWEDYQFGFGNLTGEHWLGKNSIFIISTDVLKAEIRVPHCNAIW